MINTESIIPLKREILSQEKSHAFAISAWKVLKPFINHEISDSTQKNLEELNQTLLHKSVILVGYHPHMLDGQLIHTAKSPMFHLLALWIMKDIKLELEGLSIFQTHQL